MRSKNKPKIFAFFFLPLSLSTHPQQKYIRGNEFQEPGLERKMHSLLPPVMLGSSWMDTPGLPNRHYLYTSFPTVLCSSPHFSPHLVCWQPARAGWRRDPSAGWSRQCLTFQEATFCCQHMKESIHHLPVLAEPFLLQCSWCRDVAAVVKLHLLSFCHCPGSIRTGTDF